MGLTILVGNDNAVVIGPLRAATTGELLNNQTVTGEVKDKTNASLGSPVTFTFTYTSGTEAIYVGIIPYTASLTPGEKYYVHVTANAGANRYGHWEYEATADTRRV